MNTIKNVDTSLEVVTSTLEDAPQHIADTDVLVAWGFMNIKPILEQARHLKWVHALSAGVENLNVPPIKDSSILLTNSKGIHGIPVSEHVFSMMLSFTRGLHLSLRNQQAKVWKRVTTEELHEKTLGIIGLGSIGREIAKKAKGFGMTVLATKRQMTSEIFVDNLYESTDLKEMLVLSDFVVVALPLIPETEGLIDFDHFRVMKKNAYFINIARGAVVQEQALITALQQGLIRGAGLDVFQEEPLPESSPLWSMPNVIITPHVAAISPVYLDRAIKLFADNISRYLNGTEMRNIIDKQKGY